MHVTIGSLEILEAQDNERSSCCLSCCPDLLPQGPTGPLGPLENDEHQVVMMYLDGR